MWMLAAGVLLVALVPLLLVCVLRPARDGIVALQVAGPQAALVLLLLAEALGRQPFADLALVLAVLSIPATIAFAYFLERIR